VQVPTFLCKRDHVCGAAGAKKRRSLGTTKAGETLPETPASKATRW
jgi:hypothetical protein